MAEQLAISVAVAPEGLSFAELGSKAHAFGWQKEPSEGATVFHYGNHPFSQLHSLLGPLPTGLLREPTA
jgi:hypothetical protein